jgi:ABC-2 type transport system ATP-binding protein
VGKSLNENIDHHYIASDEGSAAVNGFDVNSRQGGANLLAIYRAQSFVSGLYVREYLAFNADVYKVAKLEEVIC